MPDAELERLRVGLPESDGDELLGGGELDDNAVITAVCVIDSEPLVDIIDNDALLVAAQRDVPETCSEQVAADCQWCGLDD